MMYNKKISGTFRSTMIYGRSSRLPRKQCIPVFWLANFVALNYCPFSLSLQHSPVHENDFSEEPMHKEESYIDEEHLIESPKISSLGVPPILLTHPPPSSREALPPIRTFQLGQKDVNIVPPLPKKLPPVPDDIRLPQSLRPSDPNLMEQRPGDPEPVPSTSGIPLGDQSSADTGNALTNVIPLPPSVTEEVRGITVAPETQPAPEQSPNTTEGHHVHTEVTNDVNVEQMAETNIISAPATVIMADETKQTKPPTKSRPAAIKPSPAGVGKPNISKEKFQRKPATSSMPRAVRQKTTATKKPVSKPIASRNVKSLVPPKNVPSSSHNREVTVVTLTQTAEKDTLPMPDVKVASPSLYPEVTVVQLPEYTEKDIQAHTENNLTREAKNETEDAEVTDEQFFEPSSVKETIKPIDETNPDILDFGPRLPLENDLTIVSALNEEFTFLNQDDTLQDKGQSDSAGQQVLSSENDDIEHVKGFSTEPRAQNEPQGAFQRDDVIPAKVNTQILQVREPSPPHERLPSRESTTSISSSFVPIMPSVESVLPQERSILQNGVSKMHEDRAHQHDTDYSTDTFSSDSDFELPETKPAKKPQPFLMEAEITHIPLEHPKTPFLRDTDTRTKLSSAATQRRAMSSRLLTSSYGSRPNLQVQAYNPMEDAKQNKSAEREIKKEKVKAEKADTKKKGLKRLKAMKNVYGNMKKPVRR